MQYSTILEASQETFEQIINSCNGFEIAKVLEAIRDRDYDQCEMSEERRVNTYLHAFSLRKVPSRYYP